VQTSDGKNKFYNLPRLAISAAAVLLLSFITILALNKMGPLFESEISLEESMFLHFMENENLSAATLNPLSLEEARLYLSSQFNHSPKMPRIKGADLSGVVNIDFVPGYKTPLLEYHREDMNESIFIFAFNLDSLEVFEQIVRNPEAVNACVTNKDFHVQDVRGLHVVSWKWGNYWYAAISRQNGHELANLVEPLNDEW